MHLQGNFPLSRKRLILLPTYVPSRQIDSSLALHSTARRIFRSASLLPRPKDDLSTEDNILQDLRLDSKIGDMRRYAEIAQCKRQ